ncbi:holo-ACP synthase [Candidatus Cloacimonadaceae bacterium]
MIAGIGCDIISVERIRSAIQKNGRIAEKLFTEAERAYCSLKANPWQSYAARFAAKEAVMKALKTGWDGKVNWLDIEITLDEKGAPSISLRGGAQALAEAKGIVNIQLSLSHEKDYAIAQVVFEAKAKD